MDTAALSPASQDEGVASPETKDAKTNTHPPANALTPPTSEDMNSKVDDTSSDLSDLDMDEEEEEEEITPDHYYDGGKIPVFKPTMDQFRSFKKYVEKIDKYGMKAGIVKVIPPPEWRESLPALDELVKSIKIKNPIMQEFMGVHGTYTQANIEKQRSYNLPEWKSLTEEAQNQPPARRGERRRNQDKVVRGGGSVRNRGAAKATSEGQAPAAKRKPGRPKRNALPKEEEETETDSAKVPPTPTSPGPDDARESVEKKQDPTPTKAKKARGRPAKGHEQKSVTSRRMNNRTEAADIIDEAAFEGFDYHLDHLDEFTPERCAELETAYWKTITFAQPMYAADMPGSLFTDSTTSWNVAKLENLLDVIGTKVPGVNTAYLYLGMWKATFAWHLEDVDLYSINYIHFGAPKQWYSISQEDARRFEAAMRRVWPNDSKNCDQFLRHKTYLISPQLLEQQYNIKVNKLVHNEGEFVITYPYGYHSGYNLGYNCAESVNFALESWLDYGRIARKCECEADSVWVDVADIERKLRGEPTPEYYEETDDDEEEEETGDLPSPPASVAGKAKPSSKKRKRGIKEKEEPKKKKKKIRIRVRAITREPCVLCPNDAAYEPLLPTDNGRKAHRACALYTPETWVVVEGGAERVLGVTNIDKARLDLKCNYCRSKRGACFQCASKKCTRAFHATCAAAAGVQIDAGPVPTFGEDGTEYFEEGFDFRCRFHRPKRGKKVLDGDALENSKLVHNFARTVKAQDVVQVQYPGSDIFAGLVIENRPSELSLLVEVLPEGDRVEVEWKWVVVLDPDDSQRPKPSDAAIPMPEGMNKSSVSIENRQDGVPTMDEVFHDNETYKWAEFLTLEMPPANYRQAKISNKDQLRLDLSKPDQLYFYLPKSSTDVKGRFTDDPRGEFPVSKADFLERVKPAQVPMQHLQRQSLPASHPQKVAIAPAPSSSIPANYGRPYSYKPRIDIPNKGPYAIDNWSLDQQKQFTQDATRRASYAGASSQAKTTPPMRQQSSGPPRRDSNGQFPEDAYYSSRTLPAAFPGEYSNYVQHVRQTSGQDSRLDPSFGRRGSGQYEKVQGANAPQYSKDSRAQQEAAPMARMMNNGPLGSSHAHPSIRPKPHDPPASLQPAPVFNQRSRDADGNQDQRPQSPLSVYSAEAAKASNIQWTPPSQLYHARTYDRAQLPQDVLPAQASRPQAMHQTMQDFHTQLSQQSQMPNAGNGYGVQERMMQDMQQTYKRHPALNPPGSNYIFNGSVGSFQSPKAPTASPLSDMNTPSRPAEGTWGTPLDNSRASIGRMGQNTYDPAEQQYGYGYGNETWRFG